MTDKPNESQDRRSSHERRVLHDVNNKLTTVIGYLDLVLGDPKYQSTLSAGDYQDFQSTLTTAYEAAQSIAASVRSLQGYHQARDAGVQFVDTSSLGIERVVYNIVHVDDEPTIRNLFKVALEERSNIVEGQLGTNPELKGTFGHDGKRVGYRVHSYESVGQALANMPQESIDLLATDKDMPDRNGFNLLDSMSQPTDKSSRLPEFANIRNIVMITGGLSPEEIGELSRTYGMTILKKPFDVGALEPHIYRSINPNPSQS